MKLFLLVLCVGSMSVTMGKERRLRMFKELLAEKVWTTKRGSNNWRRLHAEEVHYWYFSTDDF